MTSICADVRDRLGDFRADLLGEAARAEFRSHLSACRECRQHAVDADPLLIFSAGRPEPVGEPEVSEILENVRAAVAVGQSARRLRRTRRPARAAAVAAAAILLIAVGGGRLRKPSPASTAALAPLNLSRTATGPSSPAIVAGAAAEAVVPASATVYEWNPTSSSPDDPKIIWIVDRSLDI